MGFASSAALAPALDEGPRTARSLVSSDPPTQPEPVLRRSSLRRSTSFMFFSAFSSAASRILSFSRSRRLVPRTQLRTLRLAP